MKIHISIFILLFFGLFFSTRLFGQECDEYSLLEMKKKYKTGNFNEIVTKLNECLKFGFRNVKYSEEAYGLLAKTYIELDLTDSAEQYTQALLNLNSNYEPAIDDPYKFKELIEGIKNVKRKTTVTSVSKKAENIRETPAFINVLTESDFIKRGYKSFDQIFNDLSGFDLAKGNGPGYLYFYQRGYRSISNDRTLMLIDGVEENDLVSDNFPLSRQYSLSDIKRVEIIYGPASTMYGANAFVGVINVITKDAADMIAEGKKFYANAQVKYGSLNTRYVDATIAGKVSDISLSLTGRVFKSNEMDLSKYPEWGYDSRTEANYLNLMTISGVDASGNYLAQNYLDKTKINTKYPNSPYYNILYDGAGKATSIDLTDAGRNKAAELDNRLFEGTVKNQDVAFNDYSLNWYLKAKLQIKDLTIGAISWKTDEGLVPWYTNYSRLSTSELSRWISWNRAFYMNYSKNIGTNLIITNLLTYKLHEVDGGTSFLTYKGYLNKSLGFLELLKDSTPGTTTMYYYRVSNQLRNELRILYMPFKQLDIMTGVEYRSSIIQGNYINGTSEYPEENGVPADSVKLLRGGNNFKSYDLGIYSQATYMPIEKLKFILGGRMDINKIRTHGGYGTVFNPRIAIVYSPYNFVYKIIYAEAFKDASYFDKYATTTNRKLNNPTLQPEKVKNFDLSAFWQMNSLFSIECIGFYSFYSNVVGSAQVILPSGEVTTQFQPMGKQEIYGVQASLDFRYGNFSAWANFTYTNPKDIESQLRISDIADFKMNTGVNYLLFRKFNIYFNGNYVGARKTGVGTFGSKNPITNFDPYFVLNSAITYQNIINGISLQLTFNNLLNKEYFTPGIREADGKT